MQEFFAMVDTPWFPYAFALLLAIPFFILLRQYIHTIIKLKNDELRMMRVKGNAAAKLQAYERIALYLERIKPANLIQNFSADITPAQFVFLTEKNIQEEFDYNASQQLYLSKNAWENTVAAKNFITGILKNTLAELSATATLQDYKTVLLMKYMQGEDAAAATIEQLRKEILIIT